MDNVDTLVLGAVAVLVGRVFRDSPLLFVVAGLRGDDVADAAVLHDDVVVHVLEVAGIDHHVLLRPGLAGLGHHVVYALQSGGFVADGDGLHLAAELIDDEPVRVALLQADDGRAAVVDVHECILREALLAGLQPVALAEELVLEVAYLRLLVSELHAVPAVHLRDVYVGEEVVLVDQKVRTFPG